jgi:hypothetical protein
VVAGAAVAVATSGGSSGTTGTVAPAQ